MANDPLPLPDVSAGSPEDPHGAHESHDSYDAHSVQDAQDAEYEAIDAEIAATERGRWFLSEHVKRNRAVDTDRLVGSLARAEAALRGRAVAATPGASADDLAQLAVAIGQVEAVIAAGAAPAASGLAASERIQGIACVLRESGTDAALCEALESALFELGDALAQHDAAAERARSAAALLRGLQASINAMITLAAGSPGAEAAAADAEPPAPAVAAALDEALPVESRPLDSMVDASPAGEGVEPPAGEAEPAAHLGSVAPSMWETAAAADAEATADDLGAPHDTSPEGVEESSSDEPPTGPLASDEILHRSFSEAAVADEALSQVSLRREPPMSEPPATAGLPRDEVPSSADEESAAASEELSEESSCAAGVPTQAAAEAAEPVLDLSAEAVEPAVAPPAIDENTGIAGQPDDSGGPNTTDGVKTGWSAVDDIESLIENESVVLPSPQPTGPQEDLDDLFEPLPLEQEVQPVPVDVVHREATQQMFSPELPQPAFSSPVAQNAASPVQPPLLAAAPPPVLRGIPRPAPNDPLATVRALSEEELIALFS
jgi:hypothetical protein